MEACSRLDTFCVLQLNNRTIMTPVSGERPLQALKAQELHSMRLPIKRYSRKATKIFIRWRTSPVFQLSSVGGSDNLAQEYLYHALSGL